MLRLFPQQLLMDEEIKIYQDKINAITLSKMDEYDYREDIRNIYEIADAIIAQELESIQNGDYDKAKDCVSLYNEIYSKFSDRGWEPQSKQKLKSYINEKVTEAHKEIMTRKFKEYENLSQDISSDELKNVLSDFVKFCEVWNIDNTADIRDEAIQTLQNIVDKIIAKLDTELLEAKEHIEFPENETRCEELQTEIEELEDEIAKVVRYSKGKELTFKQQHEIEEMKKHKIARIEEQGLDTSQLMAKINHRTTYTGAEKDEIEGLIAKKVEYLEKKLAYLQQYKNIPGNKERIAEIEQEIETVQDRWKSKNLDLKTINQIRRNNERISDQKARLSDIEWSRKGQHEETYINELNRAKEYIEHRIFELEQENELLLSGEHHRDRLEREARVKEEQQAQTEKSRETTLEEQHGEVEQVSEQHHEQPSKENIEQPLKQNIEKNIKEDIVKEAQPSEILQRVYKKDNILKTKSQQQLNIEPEEKVMPQEESIKDEIGDNVAEDIVQGEKEENANIALWMNRFEKFYNTISRLPQKIKAKFVQMKSDIVNAIKGALTERGRKQENTQTQDTNER